MMKYGRVCIRIVDEARPKEILRYMADDGLRLPSPFIVYLIPVLSPLTPHTIPSYAQNEEGEGPLTPQG